MHASRFSTRTIVLIAVAAVLAFGALGAVIGTSAESDIKFPAGIPLTSPGTGPARSGFAAPRSVGSQGGPSDSAGGDGGSVTLGRGVVTIPVPPDWDVTTCPNNKPCFEMFTPGFYAYARVFRPNATADPGVEVTRMLEGNWVSQDEHYSQVVSGEVKTEDLEDLAQGASTAQVAYTALYADTGGSFTIFGTLVVVVRADGWVLQFQFEAFGPTFDDAEAAFIAQAEFDEIATTAANSFLGG